MLDSLAQDDFSVGIVRQVEGQRIPANGAYDIVNGLLDDDLAVYRRGGSTYKTTTNFDALGLTVENLVGGQRIVMWDGSDITPVDAAGTGIVAGIGGPASGAMRVARPAVVGGVMAIPAGSEDAMFYGGSRLGGYSPPQLATVTNGSATVTWAGGPPVPALLSSADAGSFLRVDIAGVVRYAVIKTVDSNTSATLTQPWAGSTSAAATADVVPSVEFTNAFGLGFVDANYETFVASAGQRLLFGAGRRIAFTARQDPFTISEGDYHLLPDGGVLLGLWGQGDTALAFTTSGVWRYSNLAYDLTDALGNVQQVASDEGRQVILWGDGGIAGWRNVPIVPAIDDVYLLAVAPAPISGAVRPLYRSYVKAGYKPGLASVHRSHYLLPILDSSNVWVDTLVCRLDGTDSRGAIKPAWVRWDGHAGEARAFAEEIGSTTRQPKLYAIGSQRVNDLSGCFVPTAANKNDADGSTHDVTIITRDFTTRRTGSTLWKTLRARYELTDAATDNPTLTLEYQLGPPSDTWTAVSGNAPESDGTDSYEWSPDERSQAIRFRIKSSGPAAKAVLRSLELFYRQSAKR